MRVYLAVPGKLDTPTGGYIYDRHVVEGLREQGRSVEVLELGESFPSPTAADTADAESKLVGLGPRDVVIVDGLGFGALDTSLVQRIPATVIALVHHPLAREEGISSATHDTLLASERENLRHAAHVIVPSEQTASLLISDYGVDRENITVVRPGSNPPIGNREPAEPPLILSVGIQVPRKGHDVLLESLTLIRDLPWQAIIVGDERDADYAKKLHLMVNQHGLTGRIRLTGYVSDDELSQLYRSASIFALATRFEGYGIVFDEAMSYGLPIVTCSVGATPDTVSPGSAILVPRDDPHAFAEALQQILLDTRLAETMALASWNAGQTREGWDKTAKKVGRIIDTVQQGRWGTSGDRAPSDS